MKGWIVIVFTWGKTLPTSCRSMVGIGGRKGRTEMGAEARQMSQCLKFPTQCQN